jgi:hypothetical protein
MKMTDIGRHIKTHKPLICTKEKVEGGIRMACEKCPNSRICVVPMRSHMVNVKLSKIMQGRGEQK